MKKDEALGLLTVVIIYNLWIAVILVGIFIFPDYPFDALGYFGLGITTIWLGVIIINAGDSKHEKKTKAD